MIWWDIADLTKKCEDKWKYTWYYWDIGLLHFVFVCVILSTNIGISPVEMRSLPATQTGVISLECQIHQKKRDLTVESGIDRDWNMRTWGLTNAHFDWTMLKQGLRLSTLWFNTIPTQAPMGPILSGRRHIPVSQGCKWFLVTAARLEAKSSAQSHPEADWRGP